MSLIAKDIVMARRATRGGSHIWLHGRCKELAVFLADKYGGVPCWSQRARHAYCKLDGRFWDIRGRLPIHKQPNDARIITDKGILGGRA